MNNLKNEPMQRDKNNEMTIILKVDQSIKGYYIKPGKEVTAETAVVEAAAEIAVAQGSNIDSSNSIGISP